MSKRFDEATRLESRGAGRYTRDVVEGDDYWGMVTPHGGYLMSLMFAAMELEVGDANRRPRALTQHFLGRIPEGPIVIDVQIERSTRNVTSVSGRMGAPGAEAAGTATALFTTNREGPIFLDDAMPEVAPPKSREAMESLPIFVAPVHQRYDFDRRFGSDGPVVPVEDGGWILPYDEGDWDHRFALFLSDLWIPPIIRHPERVFATPTLHHTVHFGPDVSGHAGAFLAHHRLASGGDGITDEDIGIWSEDGRILLRARQLRLVVSPDSVNATRS